MAEKKTTTKKKSTTKKTKKEVVDTGASKEFVEMMANKPVSEIETKVDEENNTVIVKAKVENSINEIEVTTTVVESEQKENRITVDVQEDDKYMTIQNSQDPVGEPGPSVDDLINEGIDAFKAFIKEKKEKVAEEVNNKIVESVIDEKTFEENTKQISSDEPIEMPIVYVTTHMGISYD